MSSGEPISLLIRRAVQLKDSNHLPSQSRPVAPNGPSFAVRSAWIRRARSSGSSRADVAPRCIAHVMAREGRSGDHFRRHCGKAGNRGNRKHPRKSGSHDVTLRYLPLLGRKDSEGGQTNRKIGKRESHREPRTRLATYSNGAAALSENLKTVPQ